MRLLYCKYLCQIRYSICSMVISILIKNYIFLITIIVTIWYARMMEGVHTWPALNALL